MTAKRPINRTLMKVPTNFKSMVEELAKEHKMPVTKYLENVTGLVKADV